MDNPVINEELGLTREAVMQANSEAFRKFAVMSSRHPNSNFVHLCGFYAGATWILELALSKGYKLVKTQEESDGLAA